MLKYVGVLMLLGAATIGAATLGAQAAPSVPSAPPSVPAAQAGDPAPDPRIALLKRLPAGSKLEDLRPSPIAGIYEFAQGGEVSYLTADGKYFLDGNVYDMDTRQNLSEARRMVARAALINAVPESEMLIFSPKNPLYTITMFTDIDCPYCRKMHSEMAEMNKLGVRVRYLFYPRSGPDTESWKKAEAVWCSADRNAALTRAKAGAELDLTKTCGSTPIASEYALGQSIGVRGTPAIITENGSYISGYLPPKELVQEIKKMQSGTKGQVAAN
jgi:thiol:disulfide interchange protein DsbC